MVVIGVARTLEELGGNEFVDELLVSTAEVVVSEEVVLEVLTGVARTPEELGGDEVVNELLLSSEEEAVVDINGEAVLEVVTGEVGRILDNVGVGEVVDVLLDSTEEVVLVKDDSVDMLEVVNGVGRTPEELEGGEVVVIEVTVDEILDVESDELGRFEGEDVVLELIVGMVKLEDENEVVTRVVVETKVLEVEEDVGTGERVEDELDIGTSSLQGSVDSRFLATYRFNLERPPQN